MGAAVRAVVRVAAVLAGASALVLGGADLLHANAAVRPLWTGPNAVVLAQRQLARAQQAVGAAQAQLAALQQQVQQLSAEADSLGQVLSEVQELGLGGGGPARPGRFRREDGDGGF